MVNNNMLNDPFDFFDDIDDELKNQIELDSLLVNLSCEIINYRMENNLTQKNLADKLEITQAMVSKIESGDYNPSVEFLFNISKKLGLDLVVELRKSGNYEIEYGCENNNIYILDFAV
ncbi:MAG: helix-turn-helix transcriptional regulator [Sedimentibacter sp.]